MVAAHTVLFHTMPWPSKYMYTHDLCIGIHSDRHAYTPSPIVRAHTHTHTHTHTVVPECTAAIQASLTADPAQHQAGCGGLNGSTISGGVQ